MEQFTNPELAISSLPKHSEIAINPIHPTYWYIIAINFVISFFVVGGIIAAALVTAEALKPYTSLILTLYVLFMGTLFVLQRLAFRKRGYALRQRDLIYRRGLLATTTTIIPFNRIQHVALNEGFLSRYNGLAQLQLFTAGGSSSDMRISGLPKGEAEGMKDFILRQITHEEGSQARDATIGTPHEE